MPRCKAGDSPRSIAQTKWERHRGVPGERVRGDRLSAGELSHGVGTGEGEGTQVLPGRVRSQEDSELVLQPPKGKVKGPVALRGANPWSAQLRLLESPDDGVRTVGRGRLGRESPH